jgi:NADH-quinone oxidoreductase subunit G
VLAASAFGEKAGTTTNLEGRVSTLAQQVTPHGTSRPDWMIAIELGLRLGDRSLPADHPLRSVATVAEVTDLLAGSVQAFTEATSTALEAATDGIVLAHRPSELPTVSFAVPPRNSYDYRLVVSRKLYDRAVGTEMSRSLAKLAPGAAAHVNPLDLDSLGLAAGDDVKLVSAKASTVMPIVANTAVPRGTVWSPFNQPGGTVEEIIDATAPVTDVRIERI